MMQPLTNNQFRAEVWLDTNVAGRVENGAEWLDTVEPNWYLNVDIAELNISSGESCICGQVFMQTVFDINASLDEWEDSAYDHGFEYACSELLIHHRDYDTYNDSYLVATKLGFNIVPVLERSVEVINVISEDQRCNWSNVEWDLLAEEWIMQIQKRIAMYSIDTIES